MKWRKGLVAGHRWAGIAAALLLAVAAVSGALLVYKKPLVHWLVTPGVSLPCDYGVTQIGADLEGIDSRYLDNESTLIKAPNPEEPYWSLTGGDGDVRLLAIGSLEPYPDPWRVLKIMALLRELHVDLFAGIAGEAAMLVAGVIGLALCITGLVLWWPSRRQLHHRWLLPRRVEPRRLLHYHRHSGALSAPLLILVILTASLMLWQKLVAPLLPPVAVTTTELNEHAGATSASALLARAKAEVPDGWPTYIRLPRPGVNVASFRFRLPGEWHPNGRTSVTFDLDSRQLTTSARSDQASTTRHLVNLLYPLHSGYGLNGLYPLLVLISGIVLLWLTGTALASYLRRRRRV